MMNYEIMKNFGGDFTAIGAIQESPVSPVRANHTAAEV